MGRSVEDVISHALYDPQARHERYLKSRQLKGRKPGRLPIVKAGIGSRIVDANTPASSRHYGPTSKSIAAQRQAASDARQIAEITGRLSKLKAHLNELIAKRRAENQTSTSTKKSTSTSSKTGTSKASDKPKTSAQKEAAKQSLKKAQEARAKQQKATPNKVPLSLDEQIAHTRAVISDVEEKLRIVTARAQNQTASNGR